MMCMYPSPRGIGTGIGSGGDAAEVSRTLHHVLSGGKSFKDAVKVFLFSFRPALDPWLPVRLCFRNRTLNFRPLGL